MKGYLRLFVILALGLALLGGAACSKKNVNATSADGSAMEDEAARQRRLEEEARRQRELEQQRRAQGMAAVKEEVANMIFFDYDKFDLRSDAREILKKKGALLKDNNTLKVVIEGHCDQRGTPAYNLALGERRARAAYEYLVTLGVASSRLSIVSYGEERPLDPGHNEAAYAKNRRDEFKITEY